MIVVTKNRISVVSRSDGQRAVRVKNQTGTTQDCWRTLDLAMQIASAIEQENQLNVTEETWKH